MKSCWLMSSYCKETFKSQSRCKKMWWCMQKWGLQLCIFIYFFIWCHPTCRPLTDHFKAFLQHQMTTLQIDLATRALFRYSDRLFCGCCWDFIVYDACVGCYRWIIIWSTMSPGSLSLNSNNIETISTTHTLEEKEWSIGVMIAHKVSLEVVQIEVKKNKRFISRFQFRDEGAQDYIIDVIVLVTYRVIFFFVFIFCGKIIEFHLLK